MHSKAQHETKPQMVKHAIRMLSKKNNNEPDGVRGAVLTLLIYLVIASLMYNFI